jgi:hypothetical protein
MIEGPVAASSGCDGLDLPQSAVEVFGDKAADLAELGYFVGVCALKMRR